MTGSGSNSGKEEPKFLASNPHIKEAYEIHDKYIRALDQWEDYRDKHPNKILLWMLIRNVLTTSKAEEWGTQSKDDLPSYQTLRNAIDVEKGWDSLFDQGYTLDSEMPLVDLVQAHDKGAENKKASDSTYMQYSREIAAKRARVEQHARDLHDHLQWGAQYDEDEVIYIAISAKDGAPGSFMAEFMDLTYENQVLTMAKLTTRLSASEGGMAILGDLLHPSKAPLDASWFFDPPAQNYDVTIETEPLGGRKMKVTQMVVNAPEDSALFNNGRLDKFFGTGEQLMQLGNQIMPGLAYLYREDERKIAAQKLGYIVGGFVDDQALSNVDSNIGTPIQKLQTDQVDTISNVENVARLFGQVDDMATIVGLKKGDFSFPMFGMFMAGCSVLVKLTSESKSSLDTGMGVAKDFSDAIDATSSSVSAYRATGGGGRRLGNFSDFAGPLGDVIGAVISIKAAIADYASGNTTAGVVNTISGVSFVMTLTSSIASFGATTAIALPWVFGFGVALGIVATIASFTLGTGPLEDWLSHTYFGSNYGDETSSPEDRYYLYDYEYEKNGGDPDRKFAHQVGGYFWLTMPIADASLSSKGLTVGSDLASAEIKEETAHSASSLSGTVTAGVLEMPALAEGDEDSNIFIRTMIKESGADASIMSYLDGYLGYTGPLLHEFTLGAASGPNNDPDNGMVEVPLGLSNVTAIMYWNHTNNHVDGDINAFKLRLESGSRDAREVFGFSESELRQYYNTWLNSQSYLVVQHLPPKLKEIVEGHLSEVGANLGLNERSKLYEVMPIFPTARIPITNSL